MDENDVPSYTTIAFRKIVDLFKYTVSAKTVRRKLHVNFACRAAMLHTYKSHINEITKTKKRFSFATKYVNAPVSL